MVVVRERNIPTERPPFVVQVSANFCVVSAKDPYGRIPGFLDRTSHFLLQVAPQLYSEA
jgi:hypothetical protein